MGGRLEVWQGDITTLEVDAIVNAANAALSGGGGVDGAIHRAAGPGLLAECRALGRCPPGDARITGGHLLKARHVIHAVGPSWGGGDAGEPEQLASCYRRSLELARDHGLRSIAFPAISTGISGYPLREAAQLAVRTVRLFLAEHPLPERVMLVAYDAPTAKQLARALAAGLEATAANPRTYPVRRLD